MAMFEVKTVREVERFYSALGTNGHVSGHHDTGKGVVSFTKAKVQSVQKVGQGNNAYWKVTLLETDPAK
jgi:hypothetical protein